MWQYIAIYFIGAVVFGYMAFKLYRLLTAPPSNNPCQGCSGCALKEIKMRKGETKNNAAVCAQDK